MTKCPSCGKEITGPGYEFGDEIRMTSYECSCGTRVYVHETSKKRMESSGSEKSIRARKHGRLDLET